MSENSRQHAVSAAGRHQAVQDVARWFDYDHLPAGTPRGVSSRIADAVADVLALIGADDPQLIHGLLRLLEAKDCFVRAAIAAGDPQ